MIEIRRRSRRMGPATPLDRVVNPISRVAEEGVFVKHPVSLIRILSNGVAYPI